jgi:hypothetical protein
MAPWAQGPPERPVRFVVPPLGLYGCGCLEGGVANTHGHHALALRGVILVAPSLSANWDKVLVGEGLTSRVADPTLFGLIGINPPPSAVGLPAGRVADPTLFGLTGINPPPSAVGLPAGRVAPSSLCSPRQFSFIGAFRVGVGPNAQEAELIGKLQDSGIMLARSGREQRLDCRTIISRFQIL